MIFLTKLLTFLDRHTVTSLSVIWILLMLSLFLNSYLDPDGYLTPDSTKYLACAQSIAKDRNFYTLNPAPEKSPEPRFFATWPLGYPLLMALLKIFLPLPIFWISKILNCLILGGVLYLLHKQFKKESWVYASILLSASALELFSYSWSEVPFLLGLLMFVFSLKKSLTGPNLSTFLWLFLSVVFLFLMRYMGIIALPIILICAIKNKGATRKGLLFTFLLSSIFITGYFLMNYWLSGSLTGYARFPAAATLPEVMEEIFMGMIKEISYAFTSKFARIPVVLISIVLQVLFIGYVFRKKEKHNRPNDQESPKLQKLWKLTFLTATVYFSLLIILKAAFHFDPINFRLLFPASFMLLLGLINQLSMHGFAKRIKVIMVVLGLFSYAINVPVKHIYNHYFEEAQPTYTEHIKAIENNYKFLKKNSVVIGGNMHLRYLKDNVFVYEESEFGGIDTSEIRQLFKDFEEQVYFEN